MLTKFGMDCDLYNYHGATSHFYGNEDQATSFFFRKHGVLPKAVKCFNLGSDCTLRADKGG